MSLIKQITQVRRRWRGGDAKRAIRSVFQFLMRRRRIGKSVTIPAYSRRGMWGVLSPHASAGAESAAHQEMRNYQRQAWHLASINFLPLDLL